MLTASILRSTITFACGGSVILSACTVHSTTPPNAITKFLPWA
jgi:hypothetical protein